jgi:hypothetical protein
MSAPLKEIERQKKLAQVAGVPETNTDPDAELNDGVQQDDGDDLTAGSGEPEEGDAPPVGEPVDDND